MIPRFDWQERKDEGFDQVTGWSCTQQNDESVECKSTIFFN
jgi:hypothetical protein